jgi:hypothetical protein
MHGTGILERIGYVIPYSGWVQLKQWRPAVADDQSSGRKQPAKDPETLVASAVSQEQEAAALASKAAELEADGKLLEAKLLTRASRHRRVESLKVRAVAAATKKVP